MVRSNYDGNALRMFICFKTHFTHLCPSPAAQLFSVVVGQPAAATSGQRDGIFDASRYKQHFLACEMICNTLAIDFLGRICSQPGVYKACWDAILGRLALRTPMDPIVAECMGRIIERIITRGFAQIKAKLSANLEALQGLLFHLGRPKLVVTLKALFL
jgi:hypothetical protein